MVRFLIIYLDYLKLKDKMNSIIKNVDLDEFVNQSPEGIKMPIYNRGIDLPFGIRKRIALARALVVDGQVVILDEPTDQLTKREEINLQLD